METKQATRYTRAPILAGAMDRSRIAPQRVRVKRAIGHLGALWCAPLRFERATKDRVRILTGHLRDILKDERRPIGATVEIARGVRKRVAK